MRWIDGHLDLAYLAVNGVNIRTEPDDPAQRCISLPGLRQAGVDLCFATIFTEPGATAAAKPHGYLSSDDPDAAEAAGVRQLEVYERLEEQGELSIVRQADDLRSKTSLPRVVLLMEGADPIRSPGRLQWWHARGLRMVGLTWAAGTRYAGGNSRPPPEYSTSDAQPAPGSPGAWMAGLAGSSPGSGPLTPAGLELVQAMDELGMVHDASHLCDEAFDGLLEHARGPVIASHSNCRSLVGPWQRHLRDDQIRRIGERGGVVGLNLYSSFLVQGRRATVSDCIAHVSHVSRVMGHRGGVALGSDMDGGILPADLPIDVDHPMKLPALAEALRAAGWSSQDVDSFAWANWLGLLSRAFEVEPKLSETAARHTTPSAR